MSAIFGELLTFQQKNGPAVQLRVRGDEFYWRYETLDGYSAVYDHDLGRFSYAQRTDGKLVSARRPIDQSPPRGLRRHLREALPVRQAAKRAGARPQSCPAPGVGLLEGVRLSAGSVRGLTVLVDFADHPAGVTQAQVFRLLNGHDPDQPEPAGEPGPRGRWSVFQYFRTVSAGKLLFSNDVVGPIRLDHKQGYYLEVLMVQEALSKALEQYDLDLRDYDSLGRGVIDAVTILYSGRTVYAENLWPHNDTLELEFDGMRTHSYALLAAGRAPVDQTIGTFCHESGHMLCRLPDLYDYGELDGDTVSSRGLGDYCLMGNGNHVLGGRVPTPVCAYLRDLLGWCRRVPLDQPGRHRATHGDYGRVWKYSIETPDEYFLVENRFRTRLDQGLASSGLAVWHCDTTGSNEWQSGGVRHHYQCALLQADGRMDLERDENEGDSGDLFGRVEGIALSHATRPHSRLWDGSDSGLVIHHIGPPATTIEFQVGEPQVQKRFEALSRPDLLIPDGDPDGIEDRIPVLAAGRVVSVSVWLRVVHAGRGELRVELIGPDGTRAALFRGRGGAGANLERTFRSTQHKALARLAGQPARGEWRLWVVDRKARRAGRLDSWRLQLGLGGRS